MKMVDLTLQLRSLNESFKLDGERKILRILQKAEGNEMPHFRLLCKCKMTSRELRQCMESLIERKAVICHEETGYRNRVGLKYSLNPVLVDVELE